jgi:hypothetical protein
MDILITNGTKYIFVILQKVDKTIKFTQSNHISIITGTFLYWREKLIIQKTYLFKIALGISNSVKTVFLPNIQKEIWKILVFSYLTFQIEVYKLLFYIISEINSIIHLDFFSDSYTV